MQAQQSTSDHVQQDNLPVAAAVAPAGRRPSIVPMLRRWVPLVLTILLVPGGMLLGVALVVRYWNRRRAATLPVAATGIVRA